MTNRERMERIVVFVLRARTLECLQEMRSMRSAFGENPRYCSERMSNQRKAS